MFWVGRSEGDGTMENTTDFFILLKKGGKKNNITSDGFTEEIQLYYLDITHESRLRSQYCPLRGRFLLCA